MATFRWCEGEKADVCTVDSLYPDHATANGARTVVMKPAGLNEWQEYKTGEVKLDGGKLKGEEN